MMKIGDLIKELQSFDPQMEVLVDGYEGDFDDILITQGMNLRESFDEDLVSDWGKYVYECHESVIPPYRGRNGFKAVILSRDELNSYGRYERVDDEQ